MMLLLGLAISTAVGSAVPHGIDDLLREGDRAILRRDEGTSVQKAVEVYRRAFQRQATRATSWRLAMACYFRGFRFTKDDEDKAALFAEGRQAGLAGVALDSDCAPCHFWTAVNMSLYGQTVGVLKMLFSLAEIRRHLMRVLELEPEYALGGSYRILGLIEWNLPGILGGSNERAKHYLEKAIEVSPDALNYWTLSRFLEATGEKSTARQVALQVLKLTQPPRQQVESLEAYNDLRKQASD